MPNSDNRPFIPSAPGETSSQLRFATEAEINTPPVAYENVADIQSRISANAAATSASNQADLDSTTNDSLYSLVSDDQYYSPNILNSVRNPAYKVKLFLTTEHELVEEAATADIKSLYAALDNLPKIVVAESGVTAGFNITDFEIDQVSAPGDSNRSDYFSKMKITIVQAIGNSLVESIKIACNKLGVQNLSKFWYFVELSFIGYYDGSEGPDGDINYNPCADTSKFSNGGRWIYPISINNMAIHQDEAMTTYNLDCTPYAIDAFSDETLATIPDMISVSGATIGGFCADLEEKLTAAWRIRYAASPGSEVFKFKVINRMIDGISENPATFVLNQTDTDPIYNVAFDNKHRIPTAQIPKGTRLSDVMTFLYAHCESMQTVMLDTTSPLSLDDEGGFYKGKKYRVAMVPMIESDVRVIGYDPITGQYMKEITYNIWGFRTYGSNLSPMQYQNIKKDAQVAKDIVKELRDKKYLAKKYEYLYTGKNTDVLRFDMDFNFAFSAVLPQLSGWRNDIDSVVDHEKYNDATKDQASYSDEKNEIAIYDNYNRALNDLTGQIDQLNDSIATEQDATKKTQMQTEKASLEATRSSYTATATRLRTDYNAERKKNMDDIEKNLPKNIYIDDILDGNPDPLAMTYKQSNDDPTTSSGFSNQWHRGGSLVGALLNQQYAPITTAFSSISLEIRGDPYWLGYCGLERRVYVQNPKVDTRPDGRPNFAEGDNTFALIIKFPSGIADDGTPIIRTSDVMNGLYRVTNIKSFFTGGEFKQTLEAVRLELISLSDGGSGNSSGNNN